MGTPETSVHVAEARAAPLAQGRHALGAPVTMEANLRGHMGPWHEIY